MIKGIKDFLHARAEVKRFNSLSQAQRNIVFYSEDVHSMMHFESLISELVEQHQHFICYLTSDPNDPILQDHHPLVAPFYVGMGVVRTSLFMQLRADILIMTMPDLEIFHIKRSKVYPVHYLYLFHAMVSTHYNYRQAAFDHFDTIFCTGPYQIEEIRKTEELYGLPAKNLYEDGYRRLEELIADVVEYRENNKTADRDQRTVMLAPSWGEESTLEVCGEELIEVILNAGYRLIVRPHPMTTRKNPELIDRLRQQFSGRENFELQIDIRDKDALYDSDVLISDWSGITFEYAFSCERPVLFIDVPKKCLNPEADRIDMVPIERSIREMVGRVVRVDKLNELPSLIEELYANAENVAQSIREVRNNSVFNLNGSVEGAVNRILEISSSKKGV